MTVGLVGPRGWDGLNLFVFLPQKRQEKKTPHVDVGAAQQPPVCVYGSACLGVVLYGHGDNVCVLTVGKVTVSVMSACVPGCVGVYACVLCTSVDVPLCISQRVLLLVCPQYVTVRCLPLCVA